MTVEGVKRWASSRGLTPPVDPLPIGPDRERGGDAMAAWLAPRRPSAADRWLPALTPDRPFGPR